MKVAILQCDDVLDKFRPEFDNYPEMVTALLSAADGEMEFEVFNVQQGQFPANIRAWDLYITTGSKASAYEDLSWIRDLIGFVKQLDEAGQKLMGICFGHQIIALALGGSVEKSPKGWGIGVSENRICYQPAWMEKRPETLKLIVSHQDQVARLSEGSVVVAASDFCPHFMVQWNEHFLSVQGHPEWKRIYSRALIEHRRTIIPAERVEQGLVSLALEPDNRLFSSWILDFARG
jgi:GMP synthase-like glutamine amidotransferase